MIVEGKYPGKLDVEMPLQLKIESAANQVVIKVPLIKSNNMFTFLVERMKKNFTGKVCDLKEKSYNGLKEKFNNE